MGNFVPECPRVVSTQVKFDVISCNINVALGATTKLKQFARRFTKMCTLISLDSTKNFRFLASFIFSLSFHISRGQNRKSRFWPRRLQTRGDGWNSMLITLKRKTPLLCSNAGFFRESIRIYLQILNYWYARDYCATGKTLYRDVNEANIYLSGDCSWFLIIVKILKLKAECYVSLICCSTCIQNAVISLSW